ncbi:EAL domain-containing protein [Octadecabacter sp. G9-8]|uniref:EAL domain-containing protein n=1 Tax=Octadecabacter dasysiphoniae TaxID=2909341 RepID=A0ABS9CWN1_9RHOB|nr:EAL domain-containing protein [Octadecabacter dasysiphoniae]MCF2870795.1 EAL domain-containing protein [Octadecabacter dasysiphoniae]
MTKMDPATAALVPRVTGDNGDIVSNSLAFVRSHLDMEVAYLSEFVDENLVFRAVNAPGLEDMVSVGGSMPLDEVYCRHILEGRLPELMPDTDDVPFAQGIAMTHDLPVRSHVSIPIHRTNGDIYGMFCCLSRKPRRSLNSRDLEVMRAFASLSADQVNTQLTSDFAIQAKRDSIEKVLQTSDFEIALQPILRLQDQGVAGYEALCRFSPTPYRPPNFWFDDAAAVGLQVALELHVIEVALALLADLPAACYLAVNTSPATLATGRISPLVEAVGRDRVVVEITEHAAIDDLDVLLMEIDRLRDLGARIAVDDAGAGYSGLQQIIRLRPDVIKLDMSLTQDVDKDLARRSLASAMVQFAQDTKAHVVAEGIETEAEMQTLRMLGVELGQGYYLGRPALASLILGGTKTA